MSDHIPEDLLGPKTGALRCGHPTSAYFEIGEHGSACRECMREMVKENTKQTGVKCSHLDFQANVRIGRVTDGENGLVTGYTAELKIHCSFCKEEFVFVGMPCGYSPTQPMTSVDGTEARLPIRPSSEATQPLLGGPGFRIKRSA